MQVRGVYQRFPPPPQRVPYETRGLEVTKPALGVILGRVFVVSSGFWVVLRFAVGKLRLCRQPGAFSLIFGMHEWPGRLGLRAFLVSWLFTFARRAGYAAMGGAFASAGSVSVWRRARSSSSLVAAYTASTLREFSRAHLVIRRRL